jgi:anti-anti-sigma regulatory factor
MANTRKPSRRGLAASAHAPQSVADPLRVEAPAVEPAALPASAASAASAAAPVRAAAPAAARVSVLTLGASLSIREVGECAAQFKGLLAGGPTDIDASKLESIDTAGIQLLLAAAVAAQRRGFKLKLLGAHGLKTGAARSLGLSEHLGELAEIMP